MADKEERVLIIKITSDPYTCDIGGICKDKVCLKTLCEMGMTRQEAINKIRIAMHKIFIEQKAKRPLFLDYAEAALNALLEGVK